MNIVCLRIQSSGRRKRKITVLVESLPKNKWRNKCLPSLVFAVDMASIYPCITMRLIMEMTFINSSFVDRGNVPCTLGRHHPPGHPYLSMGASIPTHYGHTFISLWIIIVVCLGSEWVDIFTGTRHYVCNTTYWITLVQKYLVEAQNCMLSSTI